MTRIIFWSIVYLITKISIVKATPRNVLEEENCIATDLDQREDDIVVPWSYTVLRCPELKEITVAICPRHCRDPKTKKRLDPSFYVAKNVTYLLEFLLLDGQRLTYEVPLACKCVSRGSPPPPGAKRRAFMFLGKLANSFVNNIST